MKNSVPSGSAYKKSYFLVSKKKQTKKEYRIPEKMPESKVYYNKGINGIYTYIYISILS